MSRNFGDNPRSDLVWVLVLLVLAGLMVNLYLRRSHECTALGGVLVRAPFWFECVELRRVQP